MHTPTVAELVKSFGLEPHPEGGFYKETYRSRSFFKSLPAPFNGDRNYSTAIYFLLPKGTRSGLHRIRSDEIWHFYLGGSLSLVQIFPDGKCETVVLGSNVVKGEKLQHVVPAGCWFGAFPNENVEYSFVGCTVSPGFDFADFEMATRLELIKQFPEHKALIAGLTDG
jgi:predicted cupin superfamily sugar epimerase